MEGDMQQPTDLEIKAQEDISFQIDRECKLMNDRTVWCLQFSGFLFVGLQIVNQSSTNGALALIIPIAGITIGIASLVGIIAAQTSISSKVTEWEKRCEPLGFVRPIAKVGAAKGGRISEQAPPMIIIALWFLILIVNLYPTFCKT
jgi:hypothetical protein